MKVVWKRMEHLASRDESKRFVSGVSPAYPPKCPRPIKTFRSVTGCTGPWPLPATTATSSALTTPSFSFQLSLRTVKRLVPFLEWTRRNTLGRLKASLKTSQIKEKTTCLLKVFAQKQRILRQGSKILRETRVAGSTVRLTFGLCTWQLRPASKFS